MRRRPRSAALLRLGYRAAYVALGVWARVVGPTSHGVKCLVRDSEGRVLFVRHQYGSRAHWELPGGGIRRGESPAAAAAREGWEELGVSAVSWAEAGRAAGRWYGHEHVLTIFAAEGWHGPLRLDPVEIAVAQWFPLSDPPSPLGPTTAAALDVLRASA
ncbi:MAG TPA: NUDIX hydrolase [Solirubrobacteraceae bacterium]